MRSLVYVIARLLRWSRPVRARRSPAPSTASTRRRTPPRRRPPHRPQRRRARRRRMPPAARCAARHRRAPTPRSRAAPPRPPADDSAAGSRPRRRRSRRAAAAATATAARGDAGAGDADRLGDRAESRSARRTGGGRWDAAQAAWNIRLVSTTPPSPKFLGVTNSDLAFTGKYAIQGNYNGFQIFDISNPAKPTLVLTYVCPASQSDVSVYKNLLFVSGEGQTGRVDCGIQGVPEPVSKDRLRGIRIFDITDMANPKYVTNVQTCRGSHTHTVVTDPRDKANVYIYVSGSAGVRSADELPGCKDGRIDDPNSARFRLEVIKVPLAAPQKAAIVSSPRIFNGLAPPPRRVEPGRGGAATRSDPAAAAAAAGAAAGAGGCTLPRRLPVRAAAGRAVAPAADAATPDRISATTSPSIPTSGSPAARAAATGCCSTSAKSRSPKRIDRGRRHQHVVLALGDVQQRRHEDAVLRRVGRRSAAALPRHRQARVGRQRALHDRERQDDVQELLQDPGAADVVRELRRAQRLAHSDPRTRRDGAGVVSGRHLGVRLDRRRRSRRRSPSSIAVRSTARGWSRAARGRSTGTTG